MTCLASTAQGQARNRIIAQADSAFADGSLAVADSLYYMAVRLRPRDPEARTALGRYLGAQGRAKVATILLEEARMFGGSPSETGKYLAPLYEQLGEWRALLTLPGSPLSPAERRRAAWLSEHTFSTVGDNTSASIVGGPAGDTIARVAVRLGGKAVIAAILGTDTGFSVGTRIAQDVARRFEGDPTIVAFDSGSVAQLRLMNIPATIGPDASTVTLGATALGRMIMVIDYPKRRITITRVDGGKTDVRHPMVRWEGQLRVLDRERWIPLPAFAAKVAESKQTLVVDVAAGEVRVRP